MTTIGNLGTTTTVEFRFEELFEDNYFTGEYMISPSETKTALTATTQTVTSANVSYAMLEIDSAIGNRTNEWRDTSNSEAVVLSDRAKDNGTGIKSVHTNPSTDTNEWRGSVGFNDNHVTFEATHDQLNTQYGDDSTGKDDLFSSSGHSNALMIFTGSATDTDSIID
jgi:hypothetical protein